MRDMTQFYINGEWIDPVTPNLMNVYNPATDEVCGKISMGGAADVDKAVIAANKAFASFSLTSKEERLELLQSILKILVRRNEEIAHAIMEEMGAPWDLALNAQAESGPQQFAAIIEVLKNYAFEEMVGTTCVVKEPIGTCALITPWNWPISQIALKVAPAIAAGCSMILKPSEIAPFNAMLFAEVLHEAGLPKGVFNLINGDGPSVGVALSGHPGIAMISFTGSTKAGISVAQNAAPSVKRVTQELGGKSANIILSDADFSKAVAGGTRSCFSNSGQSCNAPTRMLVPIEKLDEAAEIAGKVAQTTITGKPNDDDTIIGPVVSKTQWLKIQDLIKVGIDEGANLIAGGLGKPNPSSAGYFVKPTVFSNVNNSMRIAREEIFGPVLSIIPYNSEEDAIAIANDTPYGLAGFVSSGNIKHAREVASKMRTGMVHINGAPLDSMAPFGGYKQSGNGREWGEYGMDEFLEIKSMYGFEPK
mgnify:FL=1|jgi:aldehyde dehydrogenase (NAD+)|tara:strand:+ start:3088 stop:4518 length:1431 start_codon:yes stop_codon:yes gene_type:complete